MKIEELSSPVGVALSGGAALGSAHVGALRALEEKKISIDMISGTSVGALVAALYAFGKDCEVVEEVAHNFSWSDITGFSLSKFGLFTNHKIRDILRNHIGDATFDQARIPLAIMAADIASGEKVVIREGSVADAVMASSCIPGIFQPIEKEDSLLVDGGIVENVPITPLRDMGAETIIAVDLNSNSQYKRPTNLVGLLINAFHFTLAAADRLQTVHADVLIAPDLGEFSYVDTGKSADLIQRGYDETLRVFNK